MGRGCFGLFAGFVALALLAGMNGCSQSEKTAATSSNVDSQKEESGCCGGCCGEETAAKTEDCCGKCEQEIKTEEKECCGKCEEEAKNLTSTTAGSQSTEACEYCKDDQACAECQKSKSNTAAKTEACEYCKGEEACAECEKETTSVDLKTAKQLSGSAGKKPASESTESVKTMREDRDIFHSLLENHKKISRQVSVLKNGVKTVTQSDDPVIVSKIQEHVASMKKRVEQRRPLRMWDDLYKEIFKHADKIEMKVKKIEKGVEVIETSSDPYVAKLIQEHAKVVTGFSKRGFEEAHENHVPPKK